MHGTRSFQILMNLSSPFWSCFSKFYPWFVVFSSFSTQRHQSWGLQASNYIFWSRSCWILASFSQSIFKNLQLMARTFDHSRLRIRWLKFKYPWLEWHHHLSNNKKLGLEKKLLKNNIFTLKLFIIAIKPLNCFINFNLALNFSNFNLAP